METYHNDSASNTNTILIVIVLVLLVAFGVWWFAVRGGAPEDKQPGINLDVNLPSGGSPSPSPSPTPSPSPSGGSDGGGAAY